MAGARVVTFVTGNARKLEEVQAIVGGGVKLVARALDLPELQGEPDEVARAKARLAQQQIGLGARVLVEDTSLCFNALGGLPGVYIKWFLDKTGHAGLNNLLMAYEDKSAYAQCIFALAEPDGEVRTFVGRCPGRIVPARGPTKFGWDPVFQPDGHATTFAEMTPETKNSISHRYKALTLLMAYLSQAEAASASPPASPNAAQSSPRKAPKLS
jgi:inosine triphosphate pyrophosphatase